jgi:hypothetical protein
MVADLRAEGGRCYTGETGIREGVHSPQRRRERRGKRREEKRREEKREEKLE